MTHGSAYTGAAPGGGESSAGVEGVEGNLLPGGDYSVCSVYHLPEGEGCAVSRPCGVPAFTSPTATLYSAIM